MLLTKSLEVKISNRNYKHYEELGYDITYSLCGKNKKCVPIQYLNVDIKDVAKSSKVKVKCDYCGCVIERVYSQYLGSHKIINKDCCGKCKQFKIKESIQKTYNVNNIFSVAKIKNSNLGRRNKYTLNDILKICKDKDLILHNELMKTDIIKVGDKYPFECKNHSGVIFYSTIYSLVKYQHICKQCYNEASSERQSHSKIEEVGRLCNKKGYTLLTSNIKNCDDVVEFICKKHKDYGIQTTSLWNLKINDKNCKMCSVLKKENHWNWRGGVNPINDSIRKSLDYQNWRKQIYERDNYTCQCCGETGKILNAHHIYNFADYPNLRTSIDNGITLCEDCHTKRGVGFHSLYGYSCNTYEQLAEYFKKNNKELNICNSLNIKATN